MKYFGKNQFTEFLINPINRDILIVISTGMMIAFAMVTLAMMIITQM